MWVWVGGWAGYQQAARQQAAASPAPCIPVCQHGHHALAPVCRLHSSSAWSSSRSAPYNTPGPPPPSPPFVFLPNPKQVVELSQQNTTLEEEALALEQKLGDAEQSVVGLELKVMQLEKQVNSGNTEMSAALEKAQVRR